MTITDDELIWIQVHELLHLFWFYLYNHFWTYRTLYIKHFVASKTLKCIICVNNLFNITIFYFKCEFLGY